MIFHRQSGTKPLETSQVMHNLCCKLEFFLTGTNSTPLSPFTMLVHPVTNSFWLNTTLYGERGGGGGVMGKNGVLIIFIESLKGFGPDWTLWPRSLVAFTTTIETTADSLCHISLMGALHGTDLELDPSI